MCKAVSCPFCLNPFKNYLSNNYIPCWTFAYSSCHLNVTTISCTEIIIVHLAAQRFALFFIMSFLPCDTCNVLKQSAVKY